jgi:hypothetical protein
MRHIFPVMIAATGDFLLNFPSIYRKTTAERAIASQQLTII